jgi:hypothetical protein
MTVEKELLGDVTGDGVVHVADRVEVVVSWGVCPDVKDCPADVNGDSVVGVEDMVAVVLNWS